jgi:hypothetical protein
VTDQPPATQAPVPTPAPKKAAIVDWDNVAAFVVAGGMALAIMYFNPQGAALGEASGVIGACLLYIQRGGKSS